MASNFTALYDACVLYPASLRDLLMQLAVTDLFRARWTDEIHDEWIRNEVAAAAETCRKRLQNPPKTVEEYLDILLRQRLSVSVSMLRELNNET